MMSVCPPPPRKHSAFGHRTLARGLHAWGTMRKPFFFLLALGAALRAFAPTSFAQATDLITTINDETFLSDTQERFFNAANCADPAATTFQDRIVTTPGTSVTQVYLWVGGQKSECNKEANRTDITANRCRAVLAEAAQTVDANNLLNGLTLADLTDTGLVDCTNTALQGQPYELYAFRSTPPGAVDVPPEGYGVAAFKVDVTPPNPPQVKTDPPGLGESFNMTWPQPTDNLQLYRFYRNDLEDNPATATLIDGLTGSLNATSQGFTASGSGANALGLALGESTFLYATAVDKASVEPGFGNESELSAGWKVTAAETSGFCDASGTCTGCSASPVGMASGAQGSAVWMLGLLFAVACVWRRRR